MSVTNPMPRSLAGARRCGAKTRAGTPCKQPGMANGRCKMHGGPSPGAPYGPANGAWRHGRKSRAAQEQTRAISQLLRRVKRLVSDVKGGL